MMLKRFNRLIEPFKSSYAQNTKCVVAAPFSFKVISSNRIVIKYFNNGIFQTIRSVFTTGVNLSEAETETEGQVKKNISKAMKAYLERAREHDEFMKKQREDYQIGKRHLANMMGEDPETFTQEDIDVGELNFKILFYLFIILECNRVFISIRTV